jgi:carbamoyl-phosphate synthase large subunit
MVGQSLAAQGCTKERMPPSYAVKEAVFPFIKFPGVDPILGPEMKSTGEVMGVGPVFGEAYAKSQLAAGVDLPTGGRVFVSVRDADKPAVVAVARDLAQKGFELVVTRGTAEVLREAGVTCEIINKVAEGRPHVVDAIKNGEIDLIINTTEGRQAISDSFSIRREALHHKVCYTTTMAGARATGQALDHLGSTDVRSLQDLHKEART